MKQLRLLTQTQREDLLLEWASYSPEQKEPILTNFHKQHQGDYTQDDFLQYLRQTLEGQRQWQQTKPC